MLYVLFCLISDMCNYMTEFIFLTVTFYVDF